MNIADFITELYCQIDDVLPRLPQHPQAVLSLGEVVTIGVLYAVKGFSRRAFYDWLRHNYGDLFPKLPHRTRLFRRLEAKACWTGYFQAPPTILGVADSYGVELGHPVRAGRQLHQVGRRGKSNHRWILGGKRCVVLNKLGLIVDWDRATANIHDQRFLPLLACYDGQMIILTDPPKADFHRAKACPWPEQGTTQTT